MYVAIVINDTPGFVYFFSPCTWKCVESWLFHSEVYLWPLFGATPILYKYLLMFSFFCLLLFKTKVFHSTRIFNCALHIVKLTDVLICLSSPVEGKIKASEHTFKNV